MVAKIVSDCRINAKWIVWDTDQRGATQIFYPHSSALIRVPNGLEQSLYPVAIIHRPYALRSGFDTLSRRAARTASFNSTAALH